MVTQRDIEREVTAADIDRAAGALAGDGYYRDGTFYWSEAYTADAMNAMGAELFRLMSAREMLEWRRGFPRRGERYPYRDMAVVTFRPHPIHPEAVEVELPNGERREYGAPWFDSRHDRDDLVGAVLHPEMYVECRACESIQPEWADNCGECGAEWRVCQSDCAELGGDVCFHHGAPTVPAEALESHGGNFRAAFAAMAEADARYVTVAREAARPDGIWSFPGGILHPAREG